MACHSKSNDELWRRHLADFQNIMINELSNTYLRLLPHSPTAPVPPYCSQNLYLFFFLNTVNMFRSLYNVTQRSLCIIHYKHNYYEKPFLLVCSQRQGAGVTKNIMQGLAKPICEKHTLKRVL